MTDLQKMDPYTLTTVNSDWHDTQTVKLGELMEQGFEPFGDEDWANAGWYTDEQRARVEKLIVRRYKYYEIAISPPLVWRDLMTGRAIEVVPKYTPFYKALDEGAMLTAEADEWTKNRSVYSDFPATQLNTELQDYAANSNDYQGETIRQGDYLERLKSLDNYRTLDAQLLGEFRTFFSTLATPIVRW